MAWNIILKAYNVSWKKLPEEGYIFNEFVAATDWIHKILNDGLYSRIGRIQNLV